jgi:hypothetical protein
MDDTTDRGRLRNRIRAKNVNQNEKAEEKGIARLRLGGHAIAFGGAASG